jgi:solute carrier family 15 oligopeptide transporter 1
MISDIKTIMKILLLFVPLPFFWALFDQQGSRWTLQATRMDGNIGFTEIKPDQMQLLNPLLILTFIPLFDCAVYPILQKFGLRRPLQKLTLGGILAAVAFLVSGLLEVKLEKTYPVFPSSDEYQLRIFNSLPCTYELQNFAGSAKDNELLPMNIYQYSDKISGDSVMKHIALSTTTPNCAPFSADLKIDAGKSSSFFITTSNSSNVGEMKSIEENIEKSKTANPFVRILSSIDSEVEFINHKGDVVLKVEKSDFMKKIEIPHGIYSMRTQSEDIHSSKVELKAGGVYAIIVAKNSSGSLETKIHEITMPNTVHMFWLIPQYIIMTAAEVCQ